MSKSASPRTRDLRAAYHLVGECRDLGDDPAAWVSHLAAGTAALVGGDFSGVYQYAGLATRTISMVGIREWGWENGMDRVGWQRSVTEFMRDPFYEPIYEEYFGRLATDDGLSLARTDLQPDDEWDRSWVYQHIARVMGVDHFLWCHRSIPGRPGEHEGVLIARTPGRRDFSAREKAVVRELHALVAPLVGGPLASFAEPSPSDLPPRVRLVLRCLLEGDSDKQIALRLGIGRYTVNEYVKHIFRHFGVASRTELLARWVKRNGGRFAWGSVPLV